MYEFLFLYYTETIDRLKTRAAANSATPPVDPIFNCPEWAWPAKSIWLSSSRFGEAKTDVHWFVRAFCPLPSFAMHEGDWTKICQTRGGGELDKCPSTMKYHHHDHPKATTDQYMVPATPTMEDKAGDAWGPFLSKSIKYILDRYISLNIQRHCHKWGNGLFTRRQRF